MGNTTGMTYFVCDHASVKWILSISYREIYGLVQYDFVSRGIDIGVCFIFQKSGSDMEEKMEMELREKALQSLKRQRSNNDDA